MVTTALTHRRLVYDAFGRLVRVAAVEGMDETDVALYRYNGLNMRLMWQDDADADSTLESSERFYVMFDERWRPVATFRDTDSTPKEAFVWHAAGHAGFGGGSYIDSLILRDRDHTSCGEGCDPRLAASDGTLEERRYFCQNWRADVVAVTRSDGTPIEYVRYSAYGEPTVYPIADLNMDGVVNSTDSGLWSDLLYSTSNSSVYADSDLDFDGLDDWNSGGADGDLFYESYSENLGLSGVGRISSPGVDSRTGYAGYQWDQTISASHVRYRVYLPDIGRWTRRDPLGYVDGMGLYEYVRSRALLVRDPSGRNGDTGADSPPEEIPKVPGDGPIKRAKPKNRFDSKTNGAWYHYSLTCPPADPSGDTEYVRRKGWGRVDDIVRAIANATARGCCVSYFTISAHHTPSGEGRTFTCDTDGVSDAGLVAALRPCAGALTYIEFNTCNSCGVAQQIADANPQARDAVLKCTDGTNSHHPGLDMSFECLQEIVGYQGVNRTITINPTPLPEVPDFRPDPKRPL